MKVKMPTPAARLQALPPYPFALLTQRVRELNQQGFDVIGLDIGSPDMPPPEAVVEELYRSAREPDHHGYAGYKGTPEFRVSVAQYYERRFGVKVDPEKQVLPLLGSKEGIVNLSLAYLDRGDIALVPDIGYPAYSMGALLAGGEVYWLPTREENGYYPEVENIPADVLQRAKLLWINYPNNPTGAVADLAFYKRMVDFCRQHNILLASDNPYCEVTFDGYVAGSALQVEGAMDSTIEFVSFSKSHNMAGWRLGAAVGNVDAIKTLLTVKSNVDSGHFQPIYDAGIMAFDEIPQEWIYERNQVYQRRRDKIVAALPQIGLSGHTPQGSLYVWGRVENGLGDGTKYAEEALMKAHVSVAPGGIYGPGGANYVRFSVGVPDTRLDEALERLKKWYGTR
jgi:LL-diaminopimelate aminotransferase